MKITSRSLALLNEALGRDGTVCCLLYTDRPPNAFEQGQLAARGCTFLVGPLSKVNAVRLDARDVNSVVNLGFVEGIELFEG
jgi:hypothetical protein